MPMMFHQLRDGEKVILPDSGRYGFSFLTTVAKAQGTNLWAEEKHIVTEDVNVVDEDENITFTFKKGDILEVWRS